MITTKAQQNNKKMTISSHLEEDAEQLEFSYITAGMQNDAIIQEIIPTPR